MLRRVLRVAVVFAIAAGQGGCGGGCNGGVDVDSCESPAVGSATSLELGNMATGSFEPIANGDVVPVVYGPQGGAMVGVAMRLRGDIPGCIAQSSELSPVASDEWVDTDSLPRKTYPQDDGSFTTREMFLILRYGTGEGDQVRVVTTAAGQTVERTMFLEYVGPDAGAPDAASEDAAPADAGAADAQPTDASGVDGNPSDAAAMLDAG